MNTNRQVSFSEIASGVLRATSEVNVVASGIKSLLTSKPERKMSIGLLLEKQAARYPHKPALKFDDKTWTYEEFNAWVNRVASLFAAQGVVSGDVIAVLSENRPEMLVCTAAAAKLGAVTGMLNYNQRDEVLSHSIGLIKPKIIVVGEESVDGLETTPFCPSKSTGVSYYWLGADSAQCPKGYEDLAAESESLSDTNPSSTGQVKSKQQCFYIFTSGTTGLPKASVMTHLRWLKGGAGMGLLSARLTKHDTIYVPLPLYHNNALTVSWGSALISGACVALTRRFSVSRFWDEVRQFEATAFCYIGELCRYLLNREASPDDRDHKVRLIVGNGLRAEIWMEFKNRFGIERICEFYGASECNLVFTNGLDVDCTAGFCPYPFAVVEYNQETELPKRDDRGRLKRVPTGGVGLLLTKITKLMPYDGYTDSSASEKKVLRDGFKNGDAWFNTGDLVRDQGYRHIQFVDRLGDTFRWKGENVATTEVEAAFKHVNEIEQAVVYGVEVPNADGRAGMAAITLHDSNNGFDFDGLAKSLQNSLPGYAVPLFIRVRDEHEITGTFKNRKVELKNEAFDIEQVKDPIFMFDHQQKTYVPLDLERLQQINKGDIRF